MTKIHFGSFAWAKQNQGSITWSEKLAMIRSSLIPTLQHISHQLIHPQHLNPQQALTALAFDQVQIPDTAYVQDAIAHVEQQLSASILAHSWRSYYWGYALAQRHTLDFDQETFLLSCLFHDTGLSKQHPADCQCFTLHGALQAQQWAEQQHYPQHKTQVILDSICLHMNGAETPQHGPEVRLLQWGTSCDVIGQQIHQLSQPYQQQVWQHFPAQQFYQEMQRAIDLEASHYPKSRTALLKTLGLPQLMQQFAKQQQA